MASIDNTVLTLLPELAPRISHEFGVPNHLLGLLMGLILAVVAVTGLAWGYRGDQTDRRRLLIVGTLAWAIPITAVPFSRAYLTFCALLLLAAVGLGCIATVGYSLITDLVPARWRGSLLGLWGGAQALGALGGGLLAGLLAPGADWRHRLRTGGAGAGDKHARPALVHCGRCTATGVSRAATVGSAPTSSARCARSAGWINPVAAGGAAVLRIVPRPDRIDSLGPGGTA